MNDQPDARRTPDGELASSPRAFVMGTGYLFQWVGLAFSFGACCVWSFSTRLYRAASVPAERWTDFLSGDRLPAALTTIGIATTLIGGMALMGVSIGLQGERAGSGKAAVAVTLVMALLYWTVTFGLVLSTGVTVHTLLALAFALVMSILVLLSIHSARVMKRFPPPPDLHAASDEVLSNRPRRTH